MGCNWSGSTFIFVGTQMGTKQTGTKIQIQRTRHFENLPFLYPFWVLPKRNRNGYQNANFPKYQKCHLEIPSVLIPLCALLKLGVIPQFLRRGPRRTKQRRFPTTSSSRCTSSLETKKMKPPKISPCLISECANIAYRHSPAIFHC